MEIRPYRDGDLAAVVALWQACDLTKPYNDPIADIAFCRESGHGEVFVGLDEGGTLIASAMAGHDGHRGWLYYLAVDPAAQKRGLGARMVRHAEEWLRARGVPKMQLLVRETNLGVRDFYQRLGYQRSPSMVMERWLRAPKA